MSFLFGIPLVTLPNALFTFRFSSKRAKLNCFWLYELVQHVLGFIQLAAVIRQSFIGYRSAVMLFKSVCLKLAMRNHSNWD